MNAPEKIRLHGVSLPYAPFEAPAPKGYGKTPAELDAERRIPLGGALSATRNPVAVVAREPVDFTPILAALEHGPRTAALLARQLVCPVERMTRALTHLRGQKLVKMQDRKCRSEPNLWALVAHEFPDLPPKRTGGSSPAFPLARRKADFIEAIAAGKNTSEALAAAFGLSRTRTVEILTMMTSEKTLRQICDRRGKYGTRTIYEVAE